MIPERLGQATVGVTLQLYSHVDPSLAEDAAERVLSSTHIDSAAGDPAERG